MLLTFLFPTAGVCLQLGRSQLHQFVGGNLAHCTPVPVVVRDGKVYMHGKYTGRIFAWGSGGKGVDAARRARLARLRRRRKLLVKRMRKAEEEGKQDEADALLEKIKEVSELARKEAIKEAEADKEDEAGHHFVDGDESDSDDDDDDDAMVY